MTTTFEREPAAEILLSMKVSSDLGHNYRINRGQKRPFQSEENAIAGITATTTNTPFTGMKAKKYLESNWESDQPPVQEEIEITATPASVGQFIQPQLSRQSTQTKEQQAQLPKKLKESLKHLKNLLKLPKARRWVYCEFFYSDIDRELLFAEHEFRQCLREAFPNLKTHLLRRAEWRQVRRLFGKPRRCSQAFFDSERAHLDARRCRIRELHNGKALTVDDIDIPMKIPKPLVVGVKVYARIRLPKDGVYSGTIDAVMDGRFRVIFDKDIVMPLIVFDYEVMSETIEELVSTSYFIERNKAAQSLAYRNNNMKNSNSSTNKFITTTSTADSTPPKNILVPKKEPDSPLTTYGGSSTTTSTNMPAIVPATATGTAATISSNTASLLVREDRCGNYPLRLIVMLVKLSKLIEIKKIFIAQMQEMNTEAEKMHLYADQYVRKFQERYAKTVVDLEQVNKQLETYLRGISEYIGALLPQLTEVTVTSRPDALHKFCQMHATQIVKNTNQSFHVQNQQTLDMIASLTALLLQVRALGQQRCNSFELNSLRRRIDEIKESMDDQNRVTFEDNVEVHVKQIEFTMQSGDLATLSGF